MNNLVRKKLFIRFLKEYYYYYKFLNEFNENIKYKSKNSFNKIYSVDELVEYSIKKDTNEIVAGFPWCKTKDGFSYWLEASLKWNIFIKIKYFY